MRPEQIAKRIDRTKEPVCKSEISLCRGGLGFYLQGLINPLDQLAGRLERF
jgi:hypothetical protein